MPGVLSPKQERMWKQAKKYVAKSKGKSVSSLADRDWGLVQNIFKAMKAKYGSSRVPSNYAEDKVTHWSSLPRFQQRMLEAKKLFEAVEQWNVGDIVRFSKEGRKDSYAAIVGKSRHGTPLYVAPMDDAGKHLLKDNDYGRVSAFFNGRDGKDLHGYDLSKAGKFPLKKMSTKGFSWYLTGDPDFDKGDMSNLDDRYELFTKLATNKLMGSYRRRENSNNHRRNAEIVNAFANFIAKGGKPEEFDIKYHIE